MTLDTWFSQLAKVIIMTSMYRCGSTGTKRPRRWGFFLLLLLLFGLVAQSCLTLCDPMDCSPPDSSVHAISQARILEWVAISSPRTSSRPRDWIGISCIDRQILHQLSLQGSPNEVTVEQASFSFPWHPWEKLTSLGLDGGLGIWLTGAPNGTQQNSPKFTP